MLALLSLFILEAKYYTPRITETCVTPQNEPDFDDLKAKITSKTKGILAIGIVIRGDTSHYDLVSNETFRSLGQLALDYPDISIINGVICVDNKDQLEKRYITTTTNNANALIALINEKSSKT